MKNLNRSLLVLILPFLLFSCDKVTTYKEEGVTFNNERKVLVEDYTGHKCGYCPRATRSVYDLKNIYGDNLIVLAVHAGFFAKPSSPSSSSFTYDFRNPVSTQLDTDFGISLAGNPNGMVNRKIASDGSHIFAYTAWADEVGKVLFDFSKIPVKISVANAYDDATRELQTEIVTEINVDLPSTYRICAYLVEDHIVNWQKDYDVNPSDIPDYIHREVLRGSLNGTYGDLISLTNEGEVNQNNYSIIIDQEFDAEECSIVAFLFDEDTNEIIGVEQSYIVP